MTTVQTKLSCTQLIYNSIHKQSELTPRLGGAAARHRTGTSNNEQVQTICV